jgi:hypothetical protein
MSIGQGSPATSANFNASFVSKTTDDTKVGKLALNNPSSGDAVTDVQLELNEKRMTPYAVEQISAGGTVTVSTEKGMQRRKIQSDGGAITASSTPFGSGGGWPDATVVRLLGTSDANAVTLVSSDIDYGFYINGDITLTKFVQLTVEWDATELRWYEISRNN